MSDSLRRLSEINLDLASQNNRLRDELASTSLKGGGGDGTSSGMNEGRLAKLEGFVDGFRTVPQLAVTVFGIVMGALAIVVTVGIFQLNDLSGRIKDVGTKVDAIPRQLSEEFRAMRAETALQTSAIANSITAVRQMQPNQNPSQQVPPSQNPTPLKPGSADTPP